MFDSSKIGQSLDSFSMEVPRIKIHELTSAIGDDNPVYHSREAAQAAGFLDIPLSPTSPTLFNFWGNRKRRDSLASLGLNVKGILHGEEEYEYLAPIYPHDVLTGTPTIVDGKTRQGRDGSLLDIITTETRYFNQHNQPVLIARSTLVVRELPSAAAEETNT